MPLTVALTFQFLLKKIRLNTNDVPFQFSTTKNREKEESSNTQLFGSGECVVAILTTTSKTHTATS